MSAPKVFFFGCWNEPGHYLHEPGGRVSWKLSDAIASAGDGRHIDGTLAPRINSAGQVFFAAQAAGDDNFRRFIYAGKESPQGHFLRHRLPNGYTAIQWWDRCQGDKRGACNSTVLLEGDHTTEEMLAALAQHFPHVLENLQRNGVELIEVKP